MHTVLLIFRLVRSAKSSELMPAPSDSVNLDYEGARQKTWIISLSPFIITPVIFIAAAFFWQNSVDSISSAHLIRTLTSFDSVTINSN